MSLSEYGLTVAIGAPKSNNYKGNYGRGHVYSYNNAKYKWYQVGKDIDGENVGDHSGHSVSLSKNGISVDIGAYCNDDHGNGSGHVRVYYLV